MATLKNLSVGQKIYRKVRKKCGNVVGMYRDSVHEFTVTEVTSTYAKLNDGSKKYNEQELKKFLVKKPEKK